MVVRLRSLRGLRRRRRVQSRTVSPAMGGAPRKKRSTEEHDAQVALFREHIVPRLHADAVAFAVPNGGHRAKREAIKIRDEGGSAGVPDICIIWRGVTYFLEMKALKGRVRPAQHVMMARLRGAGAICAVAKGLHEAIAQLEKWGLLRPAGEDTGAREIAA
ncbi:nuclease [Rhodopseudomonas sp. AAP120]|uniref:VRR-NUC domain-containing protein n=1 Tax=Rhodopseudomonas TaxID=1073 RepID=UPI000177970A|nr:MULTISPECIES: VRR-NUC domain-containing protein [Rhodopseudomonas]ACF00831.1 VRR-NUC domain protein [Rhodopseudomonas palustris TIE-1]KPG01744.1 nuclease [Rhodopseudomonas sp. AAP120]